MNILIIEDENPAFEHLSMLISRYDSSYNIIQHIDSVKESIQWFSQNRMPDLIFMDIQLADGLSFEIFDQVKIDVPVIFTTAYDQYAIKAFKVNSIDYLLKPIDFEGLKNAFDKFKNMTQQPGKYDNLEKVIKLLSVNHKTRFLVKVGEHLRFINTEEISYFVSLDRCSFIKTYGNKVAYAVDYSLDEIENMVNSKSFFRINRKYIISISSISDIVVFTNSRLKLKLKDCDNDDLIVSREKVQDFKKWLEE